MGASPIRLDFSRMLVDLNELVRPTLQVMDAVTAMEGDGPNSGEPRTVGAITGFWVLCPHRCGRGPGDRHTSDGHSNGQGGD